VTQFARLSSEQPSRRNSTRDSDIRPCIEERRRRAAAVEHVRASFPLVAHGDWHCDCLFRVRSACSSCLGIYRNATLNRSVGFVLITAAAVWVAVCAFFLFVGYRLLFNRPNKYGSLLPPIGWYTLAGTFVSLAALLGTASLLAGRGFNYSILCAPLGQSIAVHP